MESEDDLYKGIMDAGSAIMKLSGRAIQQMDEDVTMAQFRTLLLLSTEELRPVDIARKLGIEPSTSTRMCDRLEQRGLVEKEQTPRDKRSICIKLTQRGEDLIARANEVRQYQTTEIVRRLNLEIPPRDRRTIVQALQEFVRIIEGL